MSRLATVEWPTRTDPDLAYGIHRVLHDVAETRGAIGYLRPPTPDETDTWLQTTLTDIHDGNAALAVAHHDGRIEALGLWRRSPETVIAHTAEIQKVATHPHTRGKGLGLAIVSALIGNARHAGIETLDLGVRGNNHGAIELYEHLGFTVWGRRPNVVEVGNHRFDEVRMALTLGHPAGVVLHGSLPEGAGSSPGRRASTVHLFNDKIGDSATWPRRFTATYG